MVYVTTYYNLGTTQSGVDFVDVDVDGDVPVYIDPAAIRAQTGDWADAAVASLQSYFGCLLDAIRAQDSSGIGALIRPLVEPNETHLGESVGHSRGRSLGSESKADELIEALRTSKAAASGHLRDLDDAALMVEGIDKDIVSDITTCVIRQQLIDYTQNQANFYEIPLEEQHSGPTWNTEDLEWHDAFVELPRAQGDKLLLVPKSIVRASLTTDTGKYYRGFLRPYFEAAELAKPTSSLVTVLKDNRRKVVKGLLDEELGTRKSDVIRNTESYPEAVARYKTHLGKNPKPPMSNDDLKEVNGTSVEDLEDLLEEVMAVLPGPGGANSYHRAVGKLLTALFETQLGNYRVEQDIHEGIKRIDIAFDNIAVGGFFRWLSLHWPAAMVVAECKNYSSDVANPEFDQLAMRFSKERGEIGFLVCRSIQDPAKAKARARAIAADGHGFVVILTDADLEQLVLDAKSTPTSAERFDFPVIRAQFDALTNAV